MFYCSSSSSSNAPPLPLLGVIERQQLGSNAPCVAVDSHTQQQNQQQQ
jgi:hypothetical protein